MSEILAKMNAAEWVAVVLGALAFAGTVWSNYIAHKALKAAGHQQLAEFRKQWIETLRSEVSNFLAKDIEFVNCEKQVGELTSITQNGNVSKELREHARDQGAQVMHKMQSAAADRQSALGTILLLLNDEDGPNGRLSAAIDKVLSAEGQTRQWAEARNETIEAARTVFKNEWQRTTKEILSI